MSQVNELQEDSGVTNYHFFIRKLHSILGLFPISLFLLEHLFTNSLILISPTLFDAAVSYLQSLPYLNLLETLFIALPLILHAVYGLYIVYVSQNNLSRYSYLRNWMYYLQRVSALVMLIFIVLHVWFLRIAHSLYGVDINSATVRSQLAEPLWLAFYVIGLLATTFHFANGLWNFTVSWGIVVGEQAQSTVWKLCMVLFVVVSAVGLATIGAFIQ